LLASVISIGSQPFGFFEKIIFLLTELVVEGWYAILETLYERGSWVSFRISMELGPLQFIIYYIILLGMG